MKTKILKLLISTALILPFASAPVRADSNAAKAVPARQMQMTAETGGPEPAAAEDSLKKESESDIGTETWSMPDCPLVSGTAGVKWAVDANMVLYFEAGELNTAKNWKKDLIHLIKEIRVVPNAEYGNLILPEDCIELFRGFSSLTKVDTARFDTSRVCLMQSMFADCTSLKHLDLSSFDTSQVQDMEGMFLNCSSLESLDLSGFDTRQVRVMRSMFLNCSSLESLDLSHFDTSLVWDCDAMDMLEGCTSLVKINFSKDFFQGDMVEACP